MFPAMLLGPSLSSILLTRLFVLGILLLLKTFFSPVYSPNRFWLGLTFGIEKCLSFIRAF